MKRKTKLHRWWNKGIPKRASNEWLVRCLNRVVNEQRSLRRRGLFATNKWFAVTEYFVFISSELLDRTK